MHGNPQFSKAVLDTFLVWLLLELLELLSRAAITIKLARHKDISELASTLGHLNRGYSVVGRHCTACLTSAWKWGGKWFYM